MVRIRLRRAGGKGQPTHRIVAANRESPRDGRFIEILGDYNPRTEPSTIRIKEDRIYYWLSVGAQPSDSVMQIFRVVGLMERYQRYKDGEDIEVLVAEGKQVEKDRNVDPRTRRDDLVKVGSPKKKEEPVEEAVADADAEADVADAVAEPAADEVEVQEVQETEAVVPDTEAEADVADTEVEADAEPETEPEADVPDVEAEPQAEEVVDAEAPVEEIADVEPQADVEEVEEEQVEVEEVPVEEAVEAETELKITAAARKLAEENGIDLSTVKGTGKDGAILKSDISKLIKD
ncbi:MAG: 30S ribosomal protein S16 [Anaerolineales bacterium]|nr:30S ribosomal protein S16 [Anaerolineales bacterium]